VSGVVAQCGGCRRSGNGSMIWHTGRELASQIQIYDSDANWFYRKTRKMEMPRKKARRKRPRMMLRMRKKRKRRWSIHRKSSRRSARNPSSALQPSTTSTSVWSVLPAPKESMTRSTQARTALKSVSQLHISFL